MKLIDALNHTRAALLEISAAPTWEGMSRKAGFAFVNTDVSKIEMPVLMAYAMIDKTGQIVQFRAVTGDMFGAKMEQQDFTSEDLSRRDQDFAGMAPHKSIKLYK